MAPVYRSAWTLADLKRVSGAVDRLRDVLGVAGRVDDLATQRFGDMRVGCAASTGCAGRSAR
jgi:hypothetical protein